MSNLTHQPDDLSTGPTSRAAIGWITARTWIRSTNYLEQKFQASLQAFTVQRAALLAIWEPLRPKTWSRSVTVTGAGKVLQRTVQSYVEWMATHERPHLKQIKRIANAIRKS